jgi:tRNA pseudouridine32 synthase/23S rRNA pseudouridine746 synthase
MRELGHPILGDPLYGDAASAPRLMLHAHTLELHHPADGTRLTLEAPVPF